VNVRFEVFTVVTMKNGVFWVVTPGGYCKNRRFGGRLRSTVATQAKGFPSSQILVTLMIEALDSSENVGSYKSHTA
jgi:hypothetical protein